MPVQTLVRFIAYLHDNKYAASSIISAVSAVAFVHKIMQVCDPSQSFIIKKIIQGCKKQGACADRRLPITVDILSDINRASEHTISSQFSRIRFQAMCSLAFYALLRIGEITATANNIQLADVQMSDVLIQITFVKYKHSQGSSSRHEIRASTDGQFCPVKSLKSYLELRGEQSGPLFVREDGSPVPRSLFCNELKAALRFSAYPTDRYTSHSFRIGGASHMASKGSSDAQIKRAGRWASDAFLGYIRLHNV